MLSAGTLRGEARQRAIERLRTLDAALWAAAWSRCDDVTMARLKSEADSELAPFRPRMASDAYRQALEASLARLVREEMRLPALVFE